MAIDKLNDDLNIVASLPTRPSALEYTTEEIKGKFDEGAKKIQSYINDTLIPQIQDEITNVTLTDNTYTYMPCRRLIKSYTTPGVYTFDTAEFPSFTGIYDVVLVGGGGGGYSGDVCHGGGAGAVTTMIGYKLNGKHTVYVGAGGESVSGMTAGKYGSVTTMDSQDNDENYFYAYAGGGQGGDAYTAAARGGGIGATDATPPNGANVYGAGGDSLGYGCGARGASTLDDVRAPMGAGGGGWGTYSGRNGAVYIYGYLKEEV